MTSWNREVINNVCLIKLLILPQMAVSKTAKKHSLEASTTKEMCGWLGKTPSPAVYDQIDTIDLMEFSKGQSWV